MRNVLLLGLTMAALGAAEDSARDLFFAAEAWKGFRVSLMVRNPEGPGRGGEGEAKDPCRVRESDPSYPFRAGDKFRMRIQANADGYLYVLTRNATGDLTILFPADGKFLKSGKLGRFESRTVPEATWFTFENRANTEWIYLVLSPVAVNDLDKLVANPRKTIKEKNLEKIFAKAGTATSLEERDEDLEGGPGPTYFVQQANWATTEKGGLVLHRLKLVNRGN